MGGISEACCASPRSGDSSGIRRLGHGETRLRLWENGSELSKLLEVRSGSDFKAGDRREKSNWVHSESLISPQN
jgi:hypothetical protein